MTTLLDKPMELFGSIRDWFSHWNSPKGTEHPVHHEEVPHTTSPQPSRDTETVTTVKAMDDSYKKMPVDTLLKLVMISKTKQYEHLAHDKFQLIHQLAHKMKALDKHLNSITNILNDSKKLDLTKKEHAEIVKGLQDLNIQLPNNKNMSFEQAHSLLKLLENARDEIDRDIKLSQNQFSEYSKDLEYIRQVLIHLITTIKETLQKFTSGIRG